MKLNELLDSEGGISKRKVSISLICIIVSSLKDYVHVHRLSSLNIHCLNCAMLFEIYAGKLNFQEQKIMVAYSAVISLPLLMSCLHILSIYVFLFYVTVCGLYLGSHIPISINLCRAV